jgi:hypothetical protein
LPNSRNPKKKSPPPAPSSRKRTEAKAKAPPARARSATRSGRLLPSETTNFAHESERQYARLLDFYEIEWEYEPRTFDVDWDEAGNVIKRFSPDFYLPKFDAYIEVTTMNQKLVTKKNRKVRRLRELYPEIQIKIFYQRDYLALLQKYGLEPTAEE